MNTFWNFDQIDSDLDTENSTSFEETTYMGIRTSEVENRDFKPKASRKDFDSPFPLTSPYIAAYLIIIVSAAVLSNSVVLLVMCVRKKKMHTFQLCLVSVCISDLLFSLCLHPMSIATALGYDAKRIFNYSGCLYFGTMALFFGTYDMVAHSLIAVLRYFNLCHPSRGKWVSKRSSLYLLFVCLVYSMMWSIGPAFSLGKYETFEVGCTMAFTDQSLSGRTFVNCAFIFVFFIPLAVTVTSYVAIVLEAGRQRKVLDNLGRVTSYGCSRLAVELKLVRLTSVIAAAYIVACFPYAIVCLFEAYGDAESISWIFRILAALFCKTATATNPLLYLFMSKSFRRDIIETFNVLFQCKNIRFFSAHLNSSSQRSSSYPSVSDTSFRSSWINIIRGSSRIKKKEQSNASSSSDTTNTVAATYV